MAYRRSSIANKTITSGIDMKSIIQPKRSRNRLNELQVGFGISGWYAVQVQRNIVKIQL